MSDSAGTGGPGFTQSPSAFSGLTNTDLRPRARKKRPVPLLNTSFVTRRGRNSRNHHMRKIFADKLDLLKASITEISAAAPESRDALLAKSFSEFEADIGATLDEVAPEPEPLAKGLNLISSLASLLTQVETTVKCICEGKAYRYSEANEECPEHIQMGLHHFLAIGEMVLREMVNDHVEMPEDEMDAEKAHQAGQLFKIDSDGGELLIKSRLPEHLVAFAEDPALLAIDRIALGRELVATGRDVLIAMDDQGLLPPELQKAIPPEDDDSEDETDQTADAGDMGEDTGDGSDMGDGTDEDGAGGDDTDQMDPLEVIVRLASAIMVVGGSLIQAQGGSAAGGEDGMGAETDEDGTGEADMESEETGGPGPAIHEGDNDGSTPEGESGQGASDHTADAMHRKNAARQSAAGPAGSRAMFSAGKKRNPDQAEKIAPGGGLGKAVEARMGKLEETLGVLTQGMARLLQQPAPGSDKGHSGITPAIPRSADGLGKAMGPDIAELAKTNPEAAATAMIKAQMAAR
jgi:hypothetical protein